jgi:uncharacterized linocin/CFP29 family protein
MDLLRKNLAPISDEAWGEIEDLSRRYLKNSLSARFLVDVTAPKGWDHQGVSDGRLGKIKESGKVSWGLYNVKPLLELRVPFELDVWELDNAVRGAKDVDLDVVEKAAEELAAFEDAALFDGLKDGQITGLLQEAGDGTMIQFPKDRSEIASAVSEGIAQLVSRGIEGPYKLAVPMELWQTIRSFSGGGMSLEQHLEKMLGAGLFASTHLKQPVLVSARGGDFELSLGQDIAIGYSSHSARSVSLFFTESFTFRIFEARAIVVYK